MQLATSNIRLLGPTSSADARILTPQALAFLAHLERCFGPARRALLARRVERQNKFDRGDRPDFLRETAQIRAGHWQVAAPPADLRDRRVEITGPADRKMIINALNSGACVFMADFEDSCAPTWRNVIDGQTNLYDAVRRTISHTESASGKQYVLGSKPATLMVRPRGWHLQEAHVLVDGAPVSASLFDFALYFFHNARELIARGSGPYFYLAKMESHAEARLWNHVFVEAQRLLGIASGTIRATVLIETLPAAFEMDEILYELRDHSAGLNCGRWDYIFSFIKKLRNDSSCVMPERGLVTMTQHFLRSYSQLLVKTCHRRGAHAIGGMAAQIPIKNDPHRNERALSKVRADKQREAHDGHDGTWVAHPGLVELARDEFAAVMPGPNQIDRKRDDVVVSAADLLTVPKGSITENGLRQNLRVGVQYLEAWLRGNGCVPIHDLMEDAATAEISRTQVWQWIRFGAHLEDGRRIDRALCRSMLAEELAALRESPACGARLDLAASLFRDLIEGHELADFLTLLAYPHLTTTHPDQH